MKNYILLFFLLTLTTNLFSQRYSWEEFIDKMNEDQITYQEIKTLIDKNTNRQVVYKDKVAFKFLSKRGISQIDSCYEDFYEVKVVPHSGKQYRWGRVRILHRNNQIIKTTSWRNIEFEWNILNEELFHQYKTDFQRANYLASEKGLFEPDTIFKVSISCGKGPTFSRKFKELLTLIESKNKTKIIEWCQSTSPEMRCYGAMGLNTLKRMNQDLSINELALLERVSKDETTINYCAGCTKHGFGSTIHKMYQHGNGRLTAMYKDVE